MRNQGLEPTCSRTLMLIIGKGICPKVGRLFSSVGKKNKGVSKRSFKDMSFFRAMTGKKFWLPLPVRNVNILAKTPSLSPTP